jgi:molybdate transport system substrate-binding protein
MRFPTLRFAGSTIARYVSRRITAGESSRRFEAQGCGRQGPPSLGSRKQGRLTLRLIALVAALGAFLTSPAEAAQTHVAVAANFTEPAKEIAELFKQKTGHEAVLSFGASGAFFTQITHGAPFEVFLSADSERPKGAVDGGFALADSLFTYAVGKLVLWSRVIDVTDGEAALKAGQFQKLSIANPVAAPYGTAAVEAMKALGVYDALQPKIVQGNSIAQAFQFVDTRNAEVGFVALSQLYGVTAGTRWEVPQTLYSPIRQDAVLLKTGADSEASKAFLDFLKGPEARAIIERFGYALN